MRNENKKLRTAIIVCRKGEYFVGTDMLGKQRWSKHIYDAMRTRHMEDALPIALATGGALMLFNPVSGDRKQIGFRRV